MLYCILDEARRKIIQVLTKTYAKTTSMCVCDSTVVLTLGVSSFVGIV